MEDADGDVEEETTVAVEADAAAAAIMPSQDAETECTNGGNGPDCIYVPWSAAEEEEAVRRDKGRRRRKEWSTWVGLCTMIHTTACSLTSYKAGLEAEGESKS